MAIGYITLCSAKGGQAYAKLSTKHILMHHENTNYLLITLNVLEDFTCTPYTFAIADIFACEINVLLSQNRCGYDRWPALAGAQPYQGCLSIPDQES